MRFGRNATRGQLGAGVGPAPQGAEFPPRMASACVPIQLPVCWGNQASPSTEARGVPTVTLTAVPRPGTAPALTAGPRSPPTLWSVGIAWHVSQAWTGRWALVCGAEQAGDPNHEATLLNTQLPRPLLSFCGCRIMVLPLGRGMWPAGVPDTRLGLVASWPHTPKPTSRGLEDPGASFPRTPHGCGVTRGPGTSARPQTHTVLPARGLRGSALSSPPFKAKGSGSPGLMGNMTWSRAETPVSHRPWVARCQRSSAGAAAGSATLAWRLAAQTHRGCSPTQGQAPAPGFAAHLC